MKIKVGGVSFGPDGIIKHPEQELEVEDNWFERCLAELRAAPKQEPDKNGNYAVVISKAQAKAILGRH